jgi:hypothetical protein
MAKAKTPTTNGGTNTAGDGTTTATSKKTRGPSDPATTVYWNDERKTALLALLYSRPGQLTGSQVAQSLANHPAFVDQQQVMLSDLRKVGEKIRQQVNKLATVAKEKGHPEPQLRRAQTGHGNIDNVFAQALAQVGIGQTQPQTQPMAGTAATNQGTGLVGGGVPLVPVGTGNLAVGGSGLIPVPPGS